MRSFAESADRIFKKKRKKLQNRKPDLSPIDFNSVSSCCFDFVLLYASLLTNAFLDTYCKKKTD